MVRPFADAPTASQRRPGLSKQSTPGDALCRLNGEQQAQRSIVSNTLFANDGNCIDLGTDIIVGAKKSGVLYSRRHTSARRCVFLAGHLALPVSDSGAFPVSGVIDECVATTHLTIPEDKNVTSIVAHTVARSSIERVESILDHGKTTAARVKNRTARALSAMTPSNAVIINGKPSRQPNAADTAGACAECLRRCSTGACSHQPPTFEAGQLKPLIFPTVQASFLIFRNAFYGAKELRFNQSCR